MSDEQPQVTHTDLRRLLFWVEAMKRSIADPERLAMHHLSDLYGDDEWIVAERDADGDLDGAWLKKEYAACLATLGRLGGKRETTDGAELHGQVVRDPVTGESLGTFTDPAAGFGDEVEDDLAALLDEEREHGEGEQDHG